MTKAEKKKVQYLIVLLVVLAVTLAVGYRTSKPAAAFVVPAGAQQKPVTNLPVLSDARIRLDLLNQPLGSEEVGKNNVFQYRTRASEQAGGLNGWRGRGSVAPPPPPNISRTGTVQPGGPVGPPPIALKYYGFINSDKLTAVLADNSQHVFSVVEGDFVMGRYRVVRVTQTAVEIEDTESNRRQTLTLEKP